MKYLKFFEAYTEKTIINVDIQPEYKDFITFNIYEWVKFLNFESKKNKIVFLYNGHETMGMVTESDYINWLLELGVKENVIEFASFYDKGYNFFRYCMDENISEKNIVDLVKFMIKHNIDDSRMINEEMWNFFMKEYNLEKSEIRELLEFADDMIGIPELMDYINHFDNIVLTGGGITECLKEVEIALKAIEKPYTVEVRFLY